MNPNITHVVCAAGGFAAGLAAANVPLLVQKFVQLPQVSAWIRGNPKIAKEIVAELQKDVDAVADAPAPAAAPAPKA